ncbi:phosphotransferase family protein [uncultured Jatrophihabitans sp.]|uniref:phosphotransferase family protein n=1 Tax=uncultured Jatrophihabitans sp. TaxID=1610747 RepID=UPI0035CAA920
MRPHRAITRLRSGLLDEVRTLVGAVVPRPPGVPEHWVPSHGDLNPWNLRRARTGDWLIDWEDAGWAPPGTDEVYFSATSATLRRGAVQPLPIAPEHREAAARLAAWVAARPVRDRIGAQLQILLSNGSVE